MNLARNLEQVKSQLTTQTLIAATKYVDDGIMRELYHLGVVNMGENRVQDIIRKQEALKDLPIKWHFIGHLQTNKVALAINRIDCLHSLDSIRLAAEIQKTRVSPLDCFIEVKLTEEPNKTGVSPMELLEFVKQLPKYDIINIVGLMGMAEALGSIATIKKNFTLLHTLRDQVRLLGLRHAPCEWLSMGMSDDYKTAIECGTTHLRLGSILFRNEE
jgi:PLP dependent protein